MMRCPKCVDPVRLKKHSREATAVSHIVFRAGYCPLCRSDNKVPANKRFVDDVTAAAYRLGGNKVLRDLL